MNLFENLNPVQKEAVMHTTGPLLILAGAGSGKTRTLTHRIAYLIQQGVNPFHILAITFTNKAAKEMKERVENLIPNGQQVWVATFHATCVRILRREIDRLGYDRSFTIYDASDSERVIKACVKELDLNDKLYPPRTVTQFIGSQKNELITPEAAGEAEGDFRHKKLVEIYRLYQKKLKSNNALDFDDIIFRTVELFYYFPDILEKYWQRFQYILVDEYQDTNTSQYQLVMLLAKKNKNLCVVGDDDQSIYSWRGANIRNILNFEKDFPEAAVMKLEQNYRSTQTILDAANAVISHNTGRKSKRLWTESEKGSCIRYYNAQTDMEEGAFIAGEIKKEAAIDHRYGHFAVLYRNNAQSRALEEQFIISNIPYRLLGGTRFYERKEIKDILSYLRAIHNPHDDVAFTRIINVPRRGIGEASVQKINDYAVQRDISFFDALKQIESISGLKSRGNRLEEFTELMLNLIAYAENHTVSEVLMLTIEATGYGDELELADNDESQGRLENLDELIAKATEFTEKSEDASLGAFLEDVALVADVDSYMPEQEAVVLMTLHSSKGLEFPWVFIAGFEDGVFPSYMSMLDTDSRGLEEERRLCYVGITRAREKLYITSATSRRHHGQIVYNLPSRFLDEIPASLLESGKEKNNKEKRKEFSMSEKESRKGISQFAEINKAKNSIDISFGAKNYLQAGLSEPKNVELDFTLGDQVRHMKYGVGAVKEIRPAGADYEVTVEFPLSGVKKFMAHLSKLKKVES